ncbi:MAG: prephenate dehydrogenase [Lentisphaeria bacterium]|nr:prephenate dehydrogenase [Lentisphaeria bacterium]MBO5766687.1 prephenate dehydrogenase [Lentisphaeria bacterium]
MTDLQSNSNQLRVSIIGLGLLGASLGMALRGKNILRTGWARREEIRKAAINYDVVDEVFDTPQESVRNADIVVLAMPIPQILEYIPLLGDCMKKGSTITDLGSIKESILKQSATLPAEVFYIGSHPMAGTEKSGFYAAFPTLYENADVFITPAQNAPQSSVDQLFSLWECIGTHPSVIDAKHHDAIVARTSHVLHVLASALTTGILDARDSDTEAELFRGCATGFRDTCRIASSNPQMWREIVEHNREAVLDALEEFDQIYNKFKQEIRDRDFDSFEKDFARGKLLRDRWLEYKKNNSR